MNKSCIDVCDNVYDIMCRPCPDCRLCHGPKEKDHVDHEKMLECMEYFIQIREDIDDDSPNIHECDACGNTRCLRLVLIEVNGEQKDICGNCIEKLEQVLGSLNIE